MLRRALTLLVILSIAGFSYQPAYAAMFAMTGIDKAVAVEATVVEATVEAMNHDMARMPDCLGMQKSSEEQKKPCKFDGSCAARCHINSALEAFELRPLHFHYGVQRVFALSTAALAPTRPGPHFRPPIV